jgi:hypothetical protein
MVGAAFQPRSTQRIRKFDRGWKAAPTTVKQSALLVMENSPNRQITFFKKLLIQQLVDNPPELAGIV